MGFLGNYRMCVSEFLRDDVENENKAWCVSKANGREEDGLTELCREKLWSKQPRSMSRSLCFFRCVQFVFNVIFKVVQDGLPTGAL